jgi:hypothetical protein
VLLGYQDNSKQSITIPLRSDSQFETKQVVPIAEPEEVKSYSSLNADNPFVQKALDTQHEKLFSKALSLGSTKKPEAKKPPQPKKPARSKAVSGSRAPVKAPENAPSVPVEPTKSPTLQSPPKVAPAEPSGDTLLNWWSLAYQSYQGIESPEIRAWKRRNADATPQWMVKIAQDMPESTIPVKMLPGLVGRAGVELFYETVQLAGDVLQFNVKEIERFTKGQETLTVKAIMLMSKFVGEETARIAAKEDPASFEIAKNLALNFNHLEMEEQVKGGAKLVLSLFATPTGIARVAKVSGENAEKALQLVAQAEKVTAPTPAIKLKEFSAISLTGKVNLPNTYTPHAASLGKANAAQFQSLTRDLECRTCQTMFDHQGGLSYGAIQGSEIVKKANLLHNKEVILALSQRGNLKDWGKYRTQPFSTPYPTNDIAKSIRNVEAEVHFYRNIVTGDVYYAKDYKVKLHLPGNPQMPVEHFISKLPSSWRAKL